MNAGMYIFVNEGLDMSPGKIAAQAAHAAVEAYRLTPPTSNVLRMWYCGNHYAKYVMSARSSEHLRDIERYLNDRGFKTALIIDEGHTEIDPIQPTALGVELVDRDNPHVAATFSNFELLRQPRPSENRERNRRAADNAFALARQRKPWWRRG